MINGYNLISSVLENLKQNKSLVNQGRADNKGVTEKDVNRTELAMGIDMETEHTNDRSVAKEIALDHLSEDPIYYTKLKKMEAE